MPSTHTSAKPPRRVTGQPFSMLTFHVIPDPNAAETHRQLVDRPQVAALAHVAAGAWPILRRPGKPPALAIGLMHQAALMSPRGLDADLVARRQAMEDCLASADESWRLELRRAMAAMPPAHPIRAADPRLLRDLLYDAGIERCEQDLRFGAKHMPVVASADEMDAHAVAATQAACDAAMSEQRTTLFDLLREEIDEAREHGLSDPERAAELVQVAAVALAGAEMLLRPAPHPPRTPPRRPRRT